MKILLEYGSNIDLQDRVLFIFFLIFIIRSIDFHFFCGFLLCFVLFFFFQTSFCVRKDGLLFTVLLSIILKKFRKFFLNVDLILIFKMKFCFSFSFYFVALM